MTRFIADVMQDLDMCGTNSVCGEAAAIIRELIAERDKLLNGEFTAEQVNNICHNLPDTVPATEFAKGCAAEQRKLYGCAPDADKLRGLRIDVLCCDSEDDLRAMQRNVRAAITEETGK